MTTPDDALFVPDGEALLPTDSARGPWSPDALHGGPVAALLARAVESCPPDAPMLVTRLTIELLRPVPVAPLTTSATVSRPGRKVQVVDARLSAGGRDVAWARALRIRVLPTGAATAGLPDPMAGPVPGRDASAPLGLDAGHRSPEPDHVGGYRAFHSAGAEMRYVAGDFAARGPAAVWVRLALAVVPGEPPTPLQRVAAAADFGNGVSSELDFARHSFINADLSVHLHREARGEWVCLEAATTIGTPGVGVAQCALWDTHGPIGRSLQSLVIDTRRFS
ncbi:MAG TPA: thioesterase family protein [Acidimicrobiales bacterium]|nr:thioesterase family protein [Acidimicrobiales bacterium]